MYVQEFFEQISHIRENNCIQHPSNKLGQDTICYCNQNLCLYPGYPSIPDILVMFLYKANDSIFHPYVMEMLTWN